MKTVLGIDIAKATFDVCLDHNEQRASGHFDNTTAGFGQLKRWLNKKGVEQVHCCMEATGAYGIGLATFLFERGYQVSIVNAKVIHHYAKVQKRRNKTDKLDAQLIARFCKKETPFLWQPTPEAVATLQALTRRVNAILTNRTREKNRLKADKHPVAVADSIAATIAFYDQQIAQLEAEIQSHIAQHPDSLGKQMQLLTSITGIGDKTAAIIISELPDVKRFKTAKQITAYAGLTPEQLQSGPMHKSRGLIKLGSKRLRTALYFPAIVGMRFNPVLRNMAQRLADNGKCKMTIIGALMRKMLRIVYGILKNQTPFDPEFTANLARIS